MPCGEEGGPLSSARSASGMASSESRRELLRDSERGVELVVLPFEPTKAALAAILGRERGLRGTGLSRVRYTAPVRGPIVSLG